MGNNRTNLTDKYSKRLTLGDAVDKRKRSKILIARNQEKILGSIFNPHPKLSVPELKFIIDGDKRNFTYGDEPVSFSVSGSSNGAITWSVGNTSIIKIENGQLIPILGGKTNITAKIAKNGGYKSATSSITITVSEITTTIDVSTTSISLNKGGSEKLSVLSNNKEYPIKYSSSNSQVATVDENGNVKGVSAGNATISVYQDAVNGKYTSASTTVSVSVTDVSQLVTPTFTIKGVTDGQQINYNSSVDIYVETNSTGKVTWSSSNTSIASVDNGKLKGNSSGNTTITATLAQTSTHKSATASVKVTVNAITPTLTINPTSISELEVDATKQLSASSTNTSSTYTYKSSNSDVATVSASGLVTGKKAGNATITITQAALSGKYTSASSTVNVTVKEAAPKENNYFFGTSNRNNLDAIKNFNKYSQTRVTNLTLDSYNIGDEDIFFAFPSSWGTIEDIVDDDGDGVGAGNATQVLASRGCIIEGYTIYKIKFIEGLIGVNIKIIWL